MPCSPITQRIEESRNRAADSGGSMALTIPDSPPKPPVSLSRRLTTSRASAWTKHRPPSQIVWADCVLCISILCRGITTFSWPASHAQRRSDTKPTQTCNLCVYGCPRNISPCHGVRMLFESSLGHLARIIAAKLCNVAWLREVHPGIIA